MRIILFSIIVLFLIVLLAIPVYWILKHSEANKKSPPFSGYSRSIEESKDKGAFQFEMAASKTDIMLDSTHKLEIKKAWLENLWTEQVYVIGKTSIEKHDSYQLILIYDIVETGKPPKPDVYYFLGGRISRGSLSHYYCDKKDTINVPLFKEPTNFLPSVEKRIAYDSVTFVRR